MKTKLMRLEHLACMAELKDSKRIVIGKLVGKRIRGNPDVCGKFKLKIE
jgi:hypothetical protein